MNKPAKYSIFNYLTNNIWQIVLNQHSKVNFKSPFTIFVIVETSDRHGVRVDRVGRSRRFRADKGSGAERWTAHQVRPVPAAAAAAGKVDFVVTITFAYRPEKN